MVSVTLSNVDVEFTIYNSRNRSIRNDLIRRVGGGLGQTNRFVRDHVVVKALQNVDLDVRAGDRLAVIGHNGAGKSTLLRVMGGIFEPSGGAVQINGSASSLIDLSMGMDYELTGRQNIILRGVFLGMTFSQANSLVEEVEDFAELGEYIDLPLRTYSSGMILRLGFAISTSVGPEILILDELISVGDAGFAKKAEERINELISKSGIMVLASHSKEILMRYCNRAVRLDAGRLVFAGSVNDALAYD